MSAEASSARGRLLRLPSRGGIAAGASPPEPDNVAGQPAALAPALRDAAAPDDGAAKPGSAGLPGGPATQGMAPVPMAALPPVPEGEPQGEAWLMALSVRLDIPVAEPGALEAAVRRLEAQGFVLPEAPPLLMLGHGPEGPLLALTATPATADRLAALVTADPALRRRARLVTPHALARAFARLRAPPPPPPSGPTEYRAPAADVDDALAGLEAVSGGLTARRPVTGGQACVLGLCAVAAGGLMATVPYLVLNGLCLFIAAGFLMSAAARWSAARLVAAGGFRPPLRPAVRDDALPFYTVLVALRHEVAVVPRLIAHLTALDYPQARLDIRLLVDEDDPQTAAAIRRHAHGPMFELVVVPKRGPLTKPKVLDIGLQGARGSLVTVFDAEDRPQPGQLRQAAAAFAAGGPALGCVQARLSVDHGGERLITGFFALEYAMLFDGLLPFLASRGVPFLLGGTSNHFRRSALRAVGGWDAWNVTEDADLAIRLARSGYGFTVIESTTFEEAPLTVRAFLHQRGRWQKGWLQTWLVHMRAPVSLLKALGFRAFVALQLQFFGGFVANLVLPLWALMLAATLVGLPAALPDGTLMGDLLFQLGLATAGTGYAAAAVLALRVLKARPIGVSRWLIALWGLYALLLSYSTLRAMWEWLRRPHHWDKTTHGLARCRREGERAARLRAPAGSKRRRTRLRMLQQSFRSLLRAGS